MAALSAPGQACVAHRRPFLVLVASVPAACARLGPLSHLERRSVGNHGGHHLDPLQRGFLPAFHYTKTAHSDDSPRFTNSSFWFFTSQVFFSCNMLVGKPRVRPSNRRRWTGTCWIKKSRRLRLSLTLGLCEPCIGQDGSIRRGYRARPSRVARRDRRGGRMQHGDVVPGLVDRVSRGYG